MVSCAAQDGGKHAAMNTTNNMRELKFRIWDRQAKAWAENDCSLHCFSNWQIDPFTGQLTDFVGAIDGDRKTRYNANPAPNYYVRGSEIVNEPRYVLVQFTGLKDKNGVEIYEGDILSYKGVHRVGNGVSIVSFDDGSFMIGEDIASKDWAVEHEVIGNIFENSELLK